MDRTIHGVHFADLTEQEFQHLLDVATTYTPLNTTVAFWTGVHDYLDIDTKAFTDYDSYNEIKAYEQGRLAASDFVNQRLERHKLTQHAILDMIAVNTHGVWSEQFVKHVNLAFNVNLECKTYNRDNDPNIILEAHEDGGTKGLACFELAPMLCEALHVTYPTFYGRGRLVRNCVFALRQAGYGKDEPTS